MDNRAIALKLILDELDTNTISTVEQRMEVQKAVYLTQAVGIHLGYSYGWYVRGPYSPALTRDYYNLSDAAPANASLQAAAQAKLEQVKRIMNTPIDGLRRPQKLELLASLHYLIKSSGMSEAAARKHLIQVKPHLATHASRGTEVLKAEGLI
jgi:uncharacterized protein YwgA